MFKQIMIVAVGTTIGYVAFTAISLVAVKPLTSITLKRTMEAFAD